jgi:spore coat protein U-like protein
MRRYLPPALLILLGCALRAGPALAAGENCSVASTALAFGTFAPQSGTPQDATATVTVTCVCPSLCLGIRYTVAVSAGSSGTFSTRRMSAGIPTLPYNGYDSAARSTVWGDSTGGTSLPSRCRLAGAIGGTWVEPITFYGRIPAATGVAAGNYSDLLTVTVTYGGISICL